MQQVRSLAKVRIRSRHKRLPSTALPCQSLAATLQQTCRQVRPGQWRFGSVGVPSTQKALSMLLLS